MSRAQIRGAIQRRAPPLAGCGAAPRPMAIAADICSDDPHRFDYRWRPHLDGGARI